MKKLFLAALASLSLGAAAIPAYAANFGDGSTIAGASQATRMQQTGSYGP